jgi:hypothetical protein
MYVVTPAALSPGKVFVILTGYEAGWVGGVSAKTTKSITHYSRSLGPRLKPVASQIRSMSATYSSTMYTVSTFGMKFRIVMIRFVSSLTFRTNYCGRT